MRCSTDRCLALFSPGKFVRKMGTIACLRVVLSISGCLPVAIVDDQRVASVEDRAVVDPAPAARDFLGQNSRHKVIMALMDTGVDYNHPLLLQNFHFSLDAKGMPAGLGRDFIGNDAWPSPYLARTSRYDARLSGSTRAQSMIAWANARLLVRAFPDMMRFFHPSRNVREEDAADVEHGTHVAGLMVYDRPDIGLLAYRVLPHNRAAPGAAATHDYDAELAHRIEAAIEDAAKSGARVVNMSLGGDVTESNEDTYQKLQLLSDQLRSIVLRHPRVLFVVAAGNSQHWTDGKARVGYPCGIQASNVLCVGALQKNGDLASFTNVPLGVDLVFALGEDVISTVPTNICHTARANVLDDEGASDEALKRLAEDVRKNCERSWFLASMSGTSMAAPIASHLAGEILAEQPELPAADVIREIYERSEHAHIGNYQVLKIRVKMPTWYALDESTSDSTNDLALSSDELTGNAFELRCGSAREPAYWEAYLPLAQTPGNASTSDERSSTSSRSF